MSTSIYRFEPLGEKNWLPWKMRMEAILVDQDLWEYAEGTNTCPTPEDPAKETTEEKKAVVEWKKKDAKTRSVIVQHISDNEMKHIMNCKTADEIWKNLKLVKESTSTRSIIDARRRLYHALAEEGADIADHISKMRQYHDELMMMGQKIEDKEFFYCLAVSLPPSWDTFTTIHITANDTGVKTVNATQFISAVYEEVRRRTARVETDVALRAASVPHGTRQNTSDHGCSNCGKKGHKMEDCWSKGGGKEGKGPKQGRKKKKGGGTANQAEDAPATSKDVDLSYMADNAAASTNDTTDSWWIDSCANQHLCVNKAVFTSYKPLTNRWMTGIGGRLEVKGKGTIILNCKVGDRTVRHQVEGVLYTPGFTCNLLSLAKLDKGGVGYKGENGLMHLIDRKARLVGIARVERGMYRLDAVGETAPATALVAEGQLHSWDEWHRRYGHLAYSSIDTLQRKNMVSGLHIDKETKPAAQCEACIKAKLTRKDFPKESNEKVDKPGDLTLSDVWGPNRVESISKSRYYISFTDHHSRYISVFFLKTKDEAYDKITEYLAYVETQKGYVPKAIRFDNGKELVNKRLKDWCAKKGINVQTTAPYSPSQNGIAERFNRTLLELARAMLFAKELPAFLWAEAVAHAAYLRNHSPSRALDGKTPQEMWTGMKPDISHLQEFGGDVWIREEGSVSKLAPRANKFLFVGYQDGPRAVRYYDRAKRSIKVSRNFVFRSEPMEETPKQRVIVIEGEHKENSNQQNASDNEEMEEEEEPTHQSHHLPENDDLPNPVPQPPPNPGIRERHPRKEKKLVDYRKASGIAARKPPERYLEELAKDQKRPLSPESEDGQERGQDEDSPPPASYVAYMAFLAGDGNSKHHVPKVLREAKQSSEWDQWKAAMDEEIDQLTSMRTWELVKPPMERRVIGCRWVFAKKYDEDGYVTKHKARLVAQGFSQIPGVDYTDNYAPVVRLDAIRTCIALAAVKGWTMRQIDVKGAYLNGSLEEEIYMRQPEGYDDGSGRVCKLRLSIYGLKQAGRVWNKKLHATLTNFGFNRIDADPCVYTHTQPASNKITILTVWVDDIVLCGNLPSHIDATVKALSNAFEVKDLGEPKLLLGIQITRNKSTGEIKLSQTNYINTILDRYGYAKLNPVSSPLDHKIALLKRDNNDLAAPKEIQEYQMKLGSVMYAAMATMPQLAYAVQTLSQFSKNPSPAHHAALKRVFRYLAKARNEKWGLTYGGQVNSPDELVGYTDSDWGGNPNDRKSTSGYAFLLGGGAISWSSKKQTSVALSSCEAEYMASCYAARHAIWLRRLLSNLTFPILHPTTLFTDNQAALQLTKDAIFHQRTKHIDIQYHFVRNCVLDNTLAVYYCPTENMVADIMTKALCPNLHLKFTENLGILTA